MKKNKSEIKSLELLLDFVEYCANNPEKRFWQALRNWSGFDCIYGSRVPREVASQDELHDTFYFEGKDK